MYKILVVLTAALCVSHAWEALGKPDTKPEKFKNQEGCYIKQLDIMIPFGTSAPSDNGCVQYSCGPTLIKFTGCGAVGTQPPCYTKSDPKKPYPECCPKIVCP